MGFGGGGSAAAFSGILPATTAEFGTATVADNGEQPPLIAGGNRFYGQAFVLPNTSKFYLLSGIEWKIGLTNTGNVLAGLDKIGINTVPPSATDLELVAYCPDVAAGAVSSTQRNSLITQTKPLGAGEIFIPWVSGSTVTMAFRIFSVAAENTYRAITDSRTFPSWKNTTAWTAIAMRTYIKCYFVGYG